MMNIQKMCLYNFEWQLLRVNLNFTDADTTRASIETLEEYLAKPLTGYDTRTNRLWRVLNLYNAVRMGHSGQRILSKTPEKKLDIEAKDNLIIEARRQVSWEYHSTSSKRFAWDRESEVLAIQAAEWEDVNKVLASLNKRNKFATVKKRMDTTKTRPELLQYIDILTAK
jgi:hypothetical protein